jgi:hypothetical protein
VIRAEALQFEHPSNLPCLAVTTTGVKFIHADGPSPATCWLLTGSGREPEAPLHHPSRDGWGSGRRRCTDILPRFVRVWRDCRQRHHRRRGSAGVSQSV